MDTTTQYAGLKTCFTVQSNKSAFYRTFGTETLFNNPDTGVGDNAYTREDDQRQDAQHNQNSEHNKTSHFFSFVWINVPILLRKSGIGGCGPHPSSVPSPFPNELLSKNGEGRGVG